MEVVVFPGQGSQFKGMGKALFNKYPNETTQASDALGYDIESLCVEDPDKQLHLTQYTQPALYVVNALSWMDKQQSFAQVDYLMGHSLGEYNALYASGAFDFVTGLELVKERGRLMASASGGGMLAVLGMQVDLLHDFLKKNKLSRVEIANYNTASQTVLSGDKEQIEQALALLGKLDIQAIPLNVSAAFHSSYMQAAAEEFKLFLRKVKFESLTIPVIANATARPYPVEKIAALLAKQIDSSVLWNESVRYLMAEDSRFNFVELGANPVLTNMIKSIQTNEEALQLNNEQGNDKTEEAKSESVVTNVDKVTQTTDGSTSNNKLKNVNKDSLVTKSKNRKKKNTKSTISSTTDAPSHESIPNQVTITPQQLGANSFCKRYGIKYAYLTGAMYKGIASKELVVAIGKSGLLGFLGTAGMSLEKIESEIKFIQQQLDSEQVYGANLICHLDDPQMEMDTVELYLKHGVTCIEAAAFMVMTPALVYYRLSGLYKNSDGSINCQHKIIAKVSRPEVAQAFLSPPPTHIVKKLLSEEKITQEQADMATQISMGSDLCVEADSGGHTDQGIATVLLPSIQSLKQQIEQQYEYKEPIHIGLAGGIGTPQAAAAAFIMGADFILTGSINQCTVEAGTSDDVKELLQDINVQDTDYAPAGDMFELGAKVQVLKKSVFFPARANKLFMLYNQYNSWDEIPEKIKTQLETRYFQKTFAEVWQEVQEYHQRKEQQATLDKAATNPKHKMALVFRWYFAYSTKLAFAGDEKNRVDFQVHTGPALGAFNQWVKDTPLASWKNRHVDVIAEKIMTDTARYLENAVCFLR